MTGFITFNNVEIRNIIDEIDIKEQSDFATNAYVGSEGSNTEYVSTLGRVLSFKSLVPADERELIIEYNNLHATYKKEIGVLASESYINLQGNYLITNYNVVEDTGNNYTVSWEFTEVKPFNFTKHSFQVWGSSANNTPSNTQQKTANTTKKASGSKNNTKNNTLLTSCGTLKPSNKKTKCVKYLQKFLQSHGYYKQYKLDGLYAQYTKAEVKKLQKAKKLKDTGNWDKATLKYFQKKYKVSTK